MADNRYELRSNEVQEVMNRPPHFFIGWGNTIIITLLVAGIIAINRVSLQMKESLPATLEQSSLPSGTSWRLMLHAVPSAAVKTGSQVRLSLQGINSEKTGQLRGRIDTMWRRGKASLMVVSLQMTAGRLETSAGKEITPATGMPVMLEVVTGNEYAAPYFVKKLLH